MLFTPLVRTPRGRRAAAAGVAVAALAIAGVTAVSHHGGDRTTANGVPLTPAAAFAGAVHGKGTLPSTSPAPKTFPSELKALYQEEHAYAGLPGVDPSGSITDATVLPSVTTFNQLVDRTSPKALDAAYDRGPSAWTGLARGMHQVATDAPPTKVAAALGQYYQALPQSGGTLNKLAQGDKLVAQAVADGTSYTPPTPVIFDAANCPSYSLGGDDGYDTLYGLQLAVDSANLIANPSIPFGGGAPGIVIVFGLQLTLNTLNLLVNLSQACGNASTASEVDTVNGNTIDLDNTTIALLELDNQIQAEEQSIETLLDSRTTTIINGLDTAQASLDTAQTQAVEEALAGGTNTAIASYELPSSLGGYLDSTPIGVQAIVTTALNNVEEAHQLQNPNAPNLLIQANNSLAAGQFKTAFFQYQAAYQAITH